ncbi:MAG: type I polyketide synthase [Bryobacteraceae bacterium]
MSAKESRPPSGHSIHGDVAIVGLACTYPGARNAGQFWRNIVNKLSAIADVHPDRWDPAVFYDPDPAKEDKIYCKQGGYLPNSFTFNPAKAGVPPSAIEGAEPDHYLMLRTMYEALDDAGYLKKTFDRDRVSVMMGKGNYLAPGLTWIMHRTVVSEMVMRIVESLRPDFTGDELTKIRQSIQRKLPKLNTENAAGLIPNISTGRVANRLDFMGANYTIDAACASSLLATENALHSLLIGKDDMVLAGGSHLFAHIPFLSVFDKTRAMSATSTIRPYDANADGTMSGEGIGVMVLKRLADAERDGDRIYAVIKGAGSASDGKAKGVMAPRVEGEELALRRALSMAGVAPETVELIEGHGTGTPVGDATEIEALHRAYGENSEGRRTIALGSVKSNIGHAMPAAGAAGLIKTALALYHKVLPPTLNVVEPNALLQRPESRFYLNTEARPWIHRKDGAPRRAGVNAFGFGGINAHVVLEEYRPAAETGQPTLLREWDQELFVFEGATRPELMASLDRVRGYVLSVEGVSTADLAFTLNTALTGQAERLAIIASNFEELAQRIDRAKRKLEDPDCSQIRERQGIYYFESPELHNGKVAFLFPGEGAQYVNMLSDLCIHFPEVRNCFDTADTAKKNGAPVSSVVFPAPSLTPEDEAAAEAELFSIERATETVLTADGAMFRLMEKLGLRAHMMSGHSAGEWIAMAASGMLDVDTFIGSMERLETMYRDVAADSEIPRMAMLAVGAGKERVAELASQAGVKIDLANDNCPHQTVIVVEPAHTDRVVEHFLTSGVFIEKLPYDRGYHTPAFTYICDPLRKFFASLDLNAPKVPVYSCTTAELIPEDREGILDVVANTFAKPLIFQDTIRKMYDDGARIFVELGPRGNLTAFADDILRGRMHLSVPMDQFRRPGLLGLCHGLGLLAAAHVPLALVGLYERRQPRRLTLDAKADTVLPEERQPGSIQVSLCYSVLESPPPEMMRSMAAIALQKEPAVRPPATAPPPAEVLETPAPVPITPLAEVAQSSFETPSYYYEPQQAEYVDASAGLPVEAGTLLMHEHFSLMDDFLRTQETVMSGFLAGGMSYSGGPYLEPREEEMPAHAAEWETVPDVREEPMLAHIEIAEHTPLTSMSMFVTLDLAHHKYLEDHCLYFEGSDADQQGNRILAMPLTGSLELMAEAALHLAPGERVIAIRKAQALRPVNVERGAAPARIRLNMRRQGADIRIGLHSERGDLLTEAVVVVAPDFEPAPAPEPLTLENPKRPTCPLNEVYSTHRMFHGPRFQGIQDIEKVGGNGLIARLRILPNTDCFGSTAAPGLILDPFLFDAAGQLVGYWPIDNLPDGFVLLPIRLGDVAIYGPSPAPGTELECRLWVRNVSHRQLSADFDVLLPDGTVWLRVKGWTDWRFHWERRFYDFWRFPNEYFNGRQIESPALTARGIHCRILDPMTEVEKTGLSETVWTRMILERGELAEYLGIQDDARRLPFLFRRAIAKDATRGWLAENGRSRVYPADVVLYDLPGESYDARGAWRGVGETLHTAAAYDSLFAVGAVGPTRLTIVLREVTDGEQPLEMAFAPEEREWIQRLAKPDEWTARATAAKMAVAKWLRPDLADDEFWTTLLIPQLNESTGVLAVADPGSAVNAEDTVSVITLRDGKFVMAIATN